jgi:hypothetical protein
MMQSPIWGYPYECKMHDILPPQVLQAPALSAPEGPTPAMQVMVFALLRFSRVILHSNWLWNQLPGKKQGSVYIMRFSLL